MFSKTVTKSVTSQMRVIGNTLCDDYGTETGVYWTLLENEETRNGVPAFLRTSILLKRKQDSKFQCTFKVKIDGDWKTKLKSYCGYKARDDPILFDPELPPTNNLRSEYDTGNLGALDLNKFFDIIVHTTCQKK